VRRDERAEQAHVERELQALEGREFGRFYTDPETGEARTWTDLAPLAVNVAREAGQRLERYSERARVRQAIVDRLHGMDFSYRSQPYLDRIIGRMMVARTSATLAVRLSDQKRLIRWDTKTGNSRLDPDDAREEAQRFSKRLMPRLLELQRQGARLTYAVFTVPNVAPGELRRGCTRTLGRLGRFLRRARAGEYPGIGGQILGAAAVLEAPLSESRDWNVHVNVILAHRGFIDFGELRRLWHWNVEFRPIKSGPRYLEAALREVIKYSVQAVTAKSAEHAEDGRTRAPPFVEWSDAEINEFIFGFRRFRRSRTYGCLFRLAKAEKLDVSQFVHIGLVHWCSLSKLYRCRVPILDSIPGDKSAPTDDRVRAFFQSLHVRERSPPERARARG
jgi:hypothetical protein